MAGFSRRLTFGLSSVGEFQKVIFRLFAPPLCTVCDVVLASNEAWLCRRCQTDLAAGAGHRERRLDLYGGKSISVRYSLAYGPAVARVVGDMKYSDRPGLSALLAPFLAFLLASMRLMDPVLVPVPLHAAKKRERGYNQSELLSDEVSRLTGIETDSSVLKRMRNTRSQAGLDADRRLVNVKGAFRAAPFGGLAGRHVILIDDVVTTGATMRECACALSDSGAGEVIGCAVASSG